MYIKPNDNPIATFQSDGYTRVALFLSILGVIVLGIGGGLTAGYQWILSKHWNFEASLGAGYIYSPYKKYCAVCRTEGQKDHRNYVGPTKAALSLVYLIK